MFLNPMCVCHSRDLWVAVGGFDASLPCCEDYDLFLRMGLDCRFEPIGKALGLRRRHGNNLSRRRGRTQEAEAEVLRRFAENHAGPGQLDLRIVHSRLSRLYFRAAQQYLRERQYGKSRDMARHSRRFQPTWKGTVVEWVSRLLDMAGRSRKSAAGFLPM
jgi:GT2 family glycosyltransferase